jgi:hypothetical protein
MEVGVIVYSSVRSTSAGALRRALSKETPTYFLQFYSHPRTSATKDRAGVSLHVMILPKGFEKEIIFWKRGSRMLSEAQRFAESASEIQRTWIYFRDCSWF